MNDMGNLNTPDEYSNDNFCKTESPSLLSMKFLFQVILEGTSLYRITIADVSFSEMLHESMESPSRDFTIIFLPRLISQLSPLCPVETVRKKMEMSKKKFMIPGKPQFSVKHSKFRILFCVFAM